MRTIIVKRDGIQYVEVATKETTFDKLRKIAGRVGERIDQVLFASDISHLPVPKKELN